MNCSNCEKKIKGGPTGLCRSCFAKLHLYKMGASTVYKGELATEQAIHERTQRMYPLDGVPCERCGEPATDRHHIDDDPINNDRSNIEFLCHSCHSRET